MPHFPHDIDKTSMILCRTVDELLTQVQKDYFKGLKIGFVPTMGALHDGHGSLVKRSVADNDKTVVSIYVNPTQFGEGEDLDKYPRTLEKDSELLAKAGADYIFAPDDSIMYPGGKEQREVLMSLRSMDQILCGAKRPGHFNGVLIVVSKLLNIVRPHRAYFGEKDFQQVAIIRQLVDELFFPTEIVSCPIIRESDGLAMSSRNMYLEGDYRKQALFLSRALDKVRGLASEGIPVSQLEEEVHNMLADYPLIKLDYFNIRSSAGLRSLEILHASDVPRALIAAFCGKTRLIDNKAVFPEA